MKSIFKKIRLPRKVMFVIAGGLVLSGASGAFAVYSGTDALLGVGREKPLRARALRAPPWIR